MINGNSMEERTGTNEGSEDRQKQFVAAYARSQQAIGQLLRVVVWDHQMLDDIQQAVALRLWELFDQYDQSRSFDSWARGNVVLEFTRHERRASPSLEPEVLAAIIDRFDSDPLSTAQYSDQMVALDECLETLPRSHRELILLRFHWSFDVEEIASRTNKSNEAVYKALQRLIHRLGSCVRRRLVTQFEVE